MMSIISILIVWLLAYLIGAIPFSFIIGKIYGVDIRKVGSGNVGATNVVRVCGKQAGALAYFCDIFKGIIVAVGIDMYWRYGLLLFSEGATQWTSTTQLFQWEVALMIGYLFPIAGHMFSVFLKFRGGKGVAVSLGVFLWLVPIPIWIALLLFFIVFLSTGVISLASIVAALSSPFLVWFHSSYSYGFLAYKTLLHERYPLIMFGLITFVSLFVIYKHRRNMIRLVKGTENSFKKKHG